MKENIISFPSGITAIDTGFVRPEMDASHLVLRQGRAAFIDTGPTPSVSRLMDALVTLKITPQQIDYILLTHIHLDHAGGAGELVRRLPHAQVVVHPRGASHLIDPEKLVAGTKAVYGDKIFRRLYGEVVPIPADRIITIEDEAWLELGGSRLKFIHTPGHALHHYCIIDRDSRGIFAGDTFGISYRDFDTLAGEFIFPATTPVHFDPDAAHASIERLMGYEPEGIYLTHYSRVTDLKRLAKDLHRDLDAFVALAKDCEGEEDRLGAIKRRLRAYLWTRLDAHGFPQDDRRRDTLLGMDISLNAQGLVVWLNRRGSQ
ncbi:MBL fold metallo-hydrolase [Nitrosococcus oceani]|uniref:Metallo-beta-lactamase superfamily n=2 Tax=Nitrosococcus oceani TaxID=1229 RepID=Q3J7N9_NITOC|nr:MBL fold metallo-hydrolase [Nitrosococcus oceani]KFI18388.1 beta-lactamase [Nitrosococcus oceani C-27]ABA59157.1 Metallo-beta-lactamase superfamily [Nitrosococcus oceani ATCC 19707]EDZ65805.1 metallo-beta-lactamase superfamily protein [Nitrosococcus oceani AFC27]KFI21605.1 beta-lactamase [Nitrosococcus oceani]GEM20315.1 MBL fold metallo-hydrolase [Nitrosococcus oceani]